MDAGASDYLARLPARASCCSWRNIVNARRSTISGSSGRFGNGGLEGRGFLDGSCSRPDMRLLSERNATSANDQDFTSGYRQKGNRSHRVGRPEHQTQAALARSTRLPKRFMIGAEGLEPSRARCRAGPWPSCKWRDDRTVPLICPTCQMFSQG